MQKEPYGEHVIAIQMEVTSMQQPAAWGMCAVQSSFPCLKDRLPYKERGGRKPSVVVAIFNLLCVNADGQNLSNTKVLHAVSQSKCKCNE